MEDKPTIKQLMDKIDALEIVANCAAFCCIDLDFNLKEANKEWMEGKISKGAFMYVLGRHTNLHAALHKAGLTEKNVIFGFPVKPSSEKERINNG